MRDLRHAFELDDWPLDGKVSGEFRLADRYTRPVGYGRLSILDATAWGEPFDRATSPMRFDGKGVRLDAIDIRKDAGTITGAAYVGWDGTYSFDARGERIPLEKVASLKSGTVEWTGLLHFDAAGASTFASPRYDVQMGADDVSVGGEGDRRGRHALRRQGAPASRSTSSKRPASACPGPGQIEMSDTVDAELQPPVQQDAARSVRAALRAAPFAVHARGRQRQPSASSGSWRTGIGCRRRRRSTRSTSACSTTRSRTTARSASRSRTTSSPRSS